MENKIATERDNSPTNKPFILSNMCYDICSLVFYQASILHRDTLQVNLNRVSDFLKCKHGLKLAWTTLLRHPTLITSTVFASCGIPIRHM